MSNPFKYYHSSLSCGQHFGREKTLSLLKRYFYWPNMFDSIYEVTAECETCLKAKERTYKVKPPLQLFRDGTLHGRWHIDFCGPFKETPVDKFKYIMVAVESFSSWPVAVPMRSQTSLETAQKLIECVFSVYGCAEAITTDCGKKMKISCYMTL